MPRPKMPQVAPALLLAALAAGCGPTAWENRTAGQNPPTLLDGNYNGRAELLSATGPDCPEARPGTISIGDRRLYFAYTPRDNFIAPIGPDGKLLARTPNAMLDGRIGDGILTFSVRAPGCESRYALRWSM